MTMDFGFEPVRKNDGARMLTPIRRFNRSFIGLMEMCNTGYWTPADEAQKRIDGLEVINMLLEEACHDLRLERHQFGLSVAKQNLANNTDAMPGYNAWRIGFIGALLGMVVGVLIRQAFV